VSPELMQGLVAGSTIVALLSAAGAIIVTIKWALAERALARTKAELQVSRTDQADAVKARDEEHAERVLERERAAEQVTALVKDLEHAHAELAKHVTPDAAADRLADSLRRARAAAAAVAAARGGAPRLPGDGSGAAGGAT
jgi:hypothetical protein